METCPDYGLMRVRVLLVTFGLIELKGGMNVTKTIPAVTEVICDVCGKKLTSWDKKDAHLTLKQKGLDQLGDPVCNGTRNWDLCDKCATAVETIIADMKLPASRTI